MDQGFHASFMPKPFTDHPGSGMHTHVSLFKGEENAFYDSSAELNLSAVGRSFIAGLLKHAPEITAITNQWVNSYKRLHGGGEAPAFVNWGPSDRGALVRVPMYDYRDCTAYVIEKLRENKFVVRYTHPNLLFISWKHWVPSYVRNEIKKKTGTVVDEFGNIVDTNLQETTTSESKIDSNELLFSTTKQIKNTQSATTNYKDTKTYKPSGHLVYNNNLLEKLKV